MKFISFITFLTCFFTTPREKTTSIVNNLRVEEGMSELQVDQIFQYLQEVPENSNISIALVKNDRTIFYGVYKEGKTLRTISNKNSVYEIGSLTKVFTANILSQLYVERKIQRLLDPVNRYYKRPFANHQSISFLSLANHTSGLPTLPTNFDYSKTDPKNPFKAYDRVAFYDYLYKKMRFEYRPNTTIGYSHIGSAILGMTLCKIEQKPFELMLRERILDPLSMASTGTRRDIAGNRLVPGLTAEGEKASNWDFNMMTPAGGMVSSAYDLGNFIRAQFENPSKSTLLTHEMTFKNKSQAVGLGWMYYLKEKRPILFQNGTSGGYQSVMVVDKDAKSGVVILANCKLANTKNASVFDDLAFELLQSLDTSLN